MRLNGIRWPNRILKGERELNKLVKDIRNLKELMRGKDDDIKRLNFMIREGAYDKNKSK